jgi:hypothetical protein
LKHLDPIIHEQETQRALHILRRDFSDPNGAGPRRVAEFMYRSPNDEMQADVAGFIRELLRKCGIA